MAPQEFEREGGDTGPAEKGRGIKDQVLDPFRLFLRDLEREDRSQRVTEEEKIALFNAMQQGQELFGRVVIIVMIILDVFGKGGLAMSRQVD